MSEKVVYLAYTSPNAERGVRSMIACGHCQNKTFVLVQDHEQEFPMAQCAACGALIGRIGWSTEV